MKRLFLALAILLSLTACNDDQPVAVKIILVTVPHTEGSGWGKTWYYASTTVERIDTHKRRIINGNLYGQAGETIAISKHIWRGW
jgi:hypothetical protein